MIHTQHKLRTAGRRFGDSFGRTIEPDQRFIVVEARLVFYSRRWLEDALLALRAESKEPEKAANGALVRPSPSHPPPGGWQEALGRLRRGYLDAS